MKVLSSLNELRSKKSVFLASLSFALILMSSSFSFASFAATPTFNPAINLSNDSGSAKDATVSNNGQHVYVAWTEGSKGIFFRESTNGGVTWVPPLTSSALKLSPKGGVAAFPVMFTQFQSVTSGDVYVTWAQTVTQSNGSKILQVFVATSTNNGQSFTTTQLSHNSTHSQNTPAIGADGSNVYVAWFSGRNATARGSIYLSYSNNNGATWSSATDAINPSSAGEAEIVASGSNVYLIADGIDFTTSHNSGATWSTPVNLYAVPRVTNSTSVHYGREPWVAGSGNLVYSTWEANSTTGAGYQDYGRVSIDGGVTWGPNQTLTGSINNDWEPENVAFGSNAFLTFHNLGNNGIYVTSAIGVNSETPTWGAPHLLSPTKLTSSFAHIFTSDGVNVFVMWGQKISSSSSVWNAYVSYSGNSGSTWSSPIDISNNAAGVAAGNLDVTLFAMSSSGVHCFTAWTYTNAGTSQIYFASS